MGNWNVHDLMDTAIVQRYFREHCFEQASIVYFPSSYLWSRLRFSLPRALDAPSLAMKASVRQGIKLCEVVHWDVEFVIYVFYIHVDIR